MSAVEFEYKQVTQLLKELTGMQGEGDQAEINSETGLASALEEK